MNETYFYDQLRALGNYFGKNLNDQQAVIYFRDLSYIPDNEFNHAITNIIRSKKPNPGQFPTISEIQGMCSPRQKVHKYDPDETLDRYYNRVGVGMLWEAYRILEKNGQEQFLRYCKAHSFNGEDIERVENKHKMVFPPERYRELLGKIGHQLGD